MGKRGASSSDLPRGGVRQRLAAHNAAASGSETSALAELLLTKWSWGHLSTPMVNEIAMAAVRDGARGKDLDVLASFVFCSLAENFNA